MYFSNLPLGASIALYVANEVLRRHGVVAQPELFLESHDQVSDKTPGTVFVFHTKYRSVSERNRINVVVRIQRQRARWVVGEEAFGTVKVEVIVGEKITTIEDSFQVVWADEPNPLRVLSRHPRVVFDR